MKPYAVPYFLLLLLLLLLCFVATGGDVTVSSESVGARVLSLKLVSAIAFFYSKIPLFLFLLFFCCFSIVIIFYSKNEPELDDRFNSCPTTGPTGPEITKSGRRESQQEHRHVLLMLLLSCPFAIDEFQ
jgi:hypothetical protein